MSYFKKFKLHVGDCEKYEKEIEDLAGYDKLFDGDISLWKHEKTMRVYSSEYPDLVFTLYCEDDDSGDVWVEYYKNGKMERLNGQHRLGKFREELLK